MSQTCKDAHFNFIQPQSGIIKSAPFIVTLQLKALVFVPMPLTYLGAKSKVSRCVQPLAWWSTRFVCHWCPLSDNFFSNKRPMGHITHLRNQFKSMNTFEWSYDYIYYKIGPVHVVQAEKIFKFPECTLAILLYFPNVKRCGLSI